MEGNTMKLLRPIISFALKRQDIQSLKELQPDMELLLLKSIESFMNTKYEECEELLTAVLDIIWEDLNTGHWTLVPEHQRSIYSTSSLLKVVALVQQAIGSSGSFISCLEKAVKTADLGLLLGNGHREQLTSAAYLLSQAINHYQPTIQDIQVGPKSEDYKLPISSEPVCELHCPSIEVFHTQHFNLRVPVKISGCMNHWAAMQRWSDLNYLLETAGSRTVPVELGSSYSDAEWSQQLMSLRQFITEHVSTSSSSHKNLGYLAQHQLFDQVPQLRKDIVVPDYCACSDNDDGGDVDINAWFGPMGTVSPLHYDPKHNLLCQVVGRKQVILYAPSASGCLYPHEGRLLANTARVDPENPDYMQFPDFRNTQALLCILSAGDMLYIPPTWWHHVRALDLSFSVSFWWE